MGNKRRLMRAIDEAAVKRALASVARRESGLVSNIKMVNTKLPKSRKRRRV